MKHDEISLHTKTALAAALKRAMERKPLSKITVSELIADCGVNRKTFYYHFEDIYALLRWMLEREAIEVVKQFDLLVDYPDAILFVMDYVDANRHILNCVYDSVGEEALKRFFQADFNSIVRTVIDGEERMLGLNAPEDFKQFLCKYHTAALAAMLVDWFRGDGGQDRERTLQYIALVTRASIARSLEQASRGQGEGA